MKKLFALLTALLLLTLPLLACAEQIPGTSLSIDLSAVVVEYPGDEADEELAFYCYNENESLIGMVYVFPTDATSLAELAESITEPTATSGGVTVINGIECWFYTASDDDGDYVVYTLLENGNNVLFLFYYTDEDAAYLSGDIMNTLCVK